MKKTQVNPGVLNSPEVPKDIKQQVIDDHLTVEGSGYKNATPAKMQRF